jgi:hypothetical protein
MPRILTNLKITEVSAVDKGAGEGVRILLMKRADDEPYVASRRAYFLKIFASKADVADDGDGDEIIEKASRNLVGAQGLGAAVMDHMLDRLAHLRRKHGFEKTAKDHSMDNLTKIAADIGVVGIAKAIVDKQRSYGISEEEFVGLVTEHAKAAHPNLTAEQAFAKLYESEPNVWRACAILKNAPLVADLTPLMVGDEAAQALDDPAEAVRQLREIGRNRWPTASEADQFERALTATENHKLARRAVPIPRAVTSFPFPR